MDFSQFKTPEVKRATGGLVPRTQNYDNMKYRRTSTTKGEGEKAVTTIVGKFEVSEALFEKLNLTNHALRPFFSDADPSTILVAVVNDKDGRVLKQRIDKDTKAPLQKSQEFKYDPLEIALAGAGIIVTEGEGVIGMHQFIDFESVAKNITIQGVSCIEVFKLKKGTSKEKEVEKEVTPAPAPKNEAANTTTAPTEANGVAQDAAAPAPEKGDWD